MHAMRDTKDSPHTLVCIKPRNHHKTRLAEYTDEI